jgi:hypothetical protein
MPSYYTKKENFASGISKIWCVCVCRLSPVGVFIEPWGSTTDLAEAVTYQVVAGQPSYVASRLMSLAYTDFLHCHSLSFLVYTRVQEILVQTNSSWPAGHPLGPLISGLYTLSPSVRYIPG